MATKTRGPYDKEDTEKDFMDVIDNSISEKEKQQMQDNAVEGAAQDIEGKQKADAKDRADANSRTGDGYKDSFLDVADDEKQALEDRGFLVQKASDSNKQKAQGGGRVKQYAKKRGLIIASSIALSIGGSIAGFIFSILPFELQHVKNVFETEIGGIRGTVLQTRSGRLYSRAFFFHQGPDGARFDGFRQRGLVAGLTGQNFRSNRLMADMRARGFVVEPALDANGRFTGRLQSISYASADGPVLTRVDSPGGFTRAWSDNNLARTEIKSFFKDKYPEKSWFWRARKARIVYQRWGLGRLRGNWIADGAARGLNSIRMRIRNALFGPDSTNARTRVSGSQNQEQRDADGNVIGNTDTEDIDGRFAEEGDSRIRRLLGGDTNGRTGWRTALREALSDPERLSGRVAGSALRAINLFGLTDAACDVKRIFNTAIVGSRILRSGALMKYATAFMSAADVTLTGELDNQDVGAFTELLRVASPLSGNAFFGSGSWQWASTGTGTVEGDLRSGYAIGGGLSGQLGTIDRAVDNLIPGNPNTACGIAQNVFVQGAGFLAGAIIGGFSFGLFTAGQIALGVAFGIMQAIVEAVLVPMIIDMVAGTIITGDEYGDEIAAGLLSGYMGLSAVQASNFGMKPVTNRQLAVLTQEKERQIAIDQAEMGIFERYLSPTNHRSITSVASISMPNSLRAGWNKIASIFRNPLSMVASPVDIVTSNRSYVAAQGSPQCTDPDVINPPGEVDEPLATDPFCNLIYGETISTLAIAPEDNLWVMLGAGRCGDDLVDCEFNYTDEDGDPASNERGQRYAEWQEKCVNQLDVLHDNSGEFASTGQDDCFDDFDDENRIVDNDGNVSYLSDSEAIARRNQIFDFEDLQVAYEIQDTGSYAPSNEDGEPGKAYAQETWGDGITLVNQTPTERQRFRIQRMDDVLLDSMSEEMTTDFGPPELPFVGGGSANLGLQFPTNYGSAYDNGYYQMPESTDGAYVFSPNTPPSQRCGSEALIGVIYTVAQRWRQEYPNSTIVVGDLNDSSGHVSHRRGIDVDITVTGTPDAANTASDPTGEYSSRLAILFADTGIIDVIGYQDERVINDYAAYAAANNLPGRVAFWDNHADHFHVRILERFAGPEVNSCSN